MSGLAKWYTHKHPRKWMHSIDADKKCTRFVTHSVHVKSRWKKGKGSQTQPSLSSL